MTILTAGLRRIEFTAWPCRFLKMCHSRVGRASEPGAKPKIPFWRCEAKSPVSLKLQPSVAVIAPGSESKRTSSRNQSPSKADPSRYFSLKLHFSFKKIKEEVLRSCSLRQAPGQPDPHDTHEALRLLDANPSQSSQALLVMSKCWSLCWPQTLHPKQVTSVIQLAVST